MAEYKGERAGKVAREATRLVRLFAARGRSLGGAPVGRAPHATSLGTAHHTEREPRREVEHGREEGGKMKRTERAEARERAGRQAATARKERERANKRECLRPCARLLDLVRDF